MSMTKQNNLNFFKYLSICTVICECEYLTRKTRYGILTVQCRSAIILLGDDIYYGKQQLDRVL